mmetsp:Transcript_11576/g.16217  ORF Transcript_11576/g.16217 Transcript_11576/m.16217 type:complete len:311 (+) Transcript_11576:154-1086(+)
MQTRRSARKKKEPVEEPSDIEEDVQENDDAPEEEEVSSSKSSKKVAKGKQAARELRRKTKEDLRSRTMGLGLSISSQPEESNASKHVVFEDDEIFEDTEESIDEHAGNDDGPEDHDASDDDDAVEEVKSNIARDQVLKQRAMERETATISKLKTKPKKRNKATEEKKMEEVDADDEFDENFFAQVDYEMASTRQQRKKSRINGDVPKGRHTTFMSAHDEAPAEPVQGNDNIELVVLGDNEEDNPEKSDYQERMRIVESKLGTEPSETAKVFSRNALLNGSDGSGQARKSKSKKATKANQQTGWKRSKKIK